MKRFILFTIAIVAILPALSQNVVKVLSDFKYLEQYGGYGYSQVYMIDANDVESVSYEDNGSGNSVVLHKKDGTTKQFEDYCYMDFGKIQDMYHISPAADYWWYPDDDEWRNKLSSRVFSYDHKDNNYYVVLAWLGGSSLYSKRQGICFGLNPNLTLEQCDIMMEFDDEHSIIDRWVSYNGNPLSGYILVGAEEAFYSYYSYGHKEYDLGRLGYTDQLYNWLNQPLECGQTYYYRPFAVYSYESGGQEKEYVCYGQEVSFRIPKLMADFGYGTKPLVPDDVWKVFAGSHFEVKYNTKDNWELLTKLFDEWQANSQFDLAAYTLVDEFDDGTGYQIKQIPDEFYTWLTKREIVIRPTVAPYVGPMTTDSNGELVSLLVVTPVTGVPEEWHVPDNEYIVVESSQKSKQCEISFTDLGIMPNVHYKVTIVFAPETREEMQGTDYMLSTRVNIGTPYQQFEFNGSNRVDIPATEVTTLVYDDYVSPYFDADNNTLKIRTDVSAADRSRKIRSRILHIGQIKLTPIE